MAVRLTQQEGEIGLVGRLGIVAGRTADAHRRLRAERLALEKLRLRRERGAHGLQALGPPGDLGNLALQLALAEKADRDQPVNIEADRLTVDDRNKVHIFEGNVILTQGTLTIRGDKLVVTQDAAGFQNGVATAAGKGLATFRQRRDGSAEYVEGEAERIDAVGESTIVTLENGDKIDADKVVIACGAWKRWP